MSAQCPAPSPPALLLCLPTHDLVCVFHLYSIVSNERWVHGKIVASKFEEGG